jgi:hypothetical protein
MQLQALTLLLAIAVAGCNHFSAPRPAAPPATAQGRLEAGNPVIVRMVSRSKTLTIASTPRGPVYSVADAKGQPLLSQGTLDDLRRLHPELYRHVRSALVSTREDGESSSAPADPEEPLDFLLLADNR